MNTKSLQKKLKVTKNENEKRYVELRKVSKERIEVFTNHIVHCFYFFQQILKIGLKIRPFLILCFKMAFLLFLGGLKFKINLKTFDSFFVEHPLLVGF